MNDVQSPDQSVQSAYRTHAEGIAPESLKRVFVQGFTTRKIGHGFGLYRCVLAAQEMGRALSVHSDGVGQSARCTLDIPVAQEIA